MQSALSLEQETVPRVLSNVSDHDESVSVGANVRQSLRISRIGLSIGLAAFFVSHTATADDIPTKTENLAFFERKVRPLFVKHCLRCHGPKKQEGGLRLDSRASLLKGGDSGPAVQLKDPLRSLLIQAVNRRGDFKMPPDRKLTPAEVATLERWAKLGSPWTPSVKTSRTAPPRDANSHWAFQPVRQVTVPPTQDRRWPKNPIDCFVLSKLESINLRPSQEADRRTLIRRATFDLIGLPPTPDDVQRFLADQSPNAFANVVDRLLASPQYGERWGRHWLDVARYADNKGYVFFEEKSFPWAYTYRDYVIRSFNSDLPFDRFLLEQLAADRLRPLRDPRSLAALGFLTVGDRFTNNLHDVIDDRIDVVSRGLLGLTVGCARCHDHKYDPITQDDYYALYGVFRSCLEPTVPPLLTSPPQTPEYRKFDKELKARVGRLQEFVNRKHRELMTSSRKRAAEYLIAAEAARGQPRVDQFMLLVQKGGLNPKMVLRWQLLLERTAKQHDPIWSTWHAFAAIKSLKQKAFQEQARQLVARLSQPSPKLPVNPLVRAAFVNRSPKTFQEVADRYAELLNHIDRDWQSLLTEAVAVKHPLPKHLESPAAEALRQQFYGPHAPPDVPMAFGWGFLDLLPDRPAQAEYKKLLKAVESWMIKGKGTQPRAMVLVNAPVLYNPHVFLRGNPNRLGKRVPRHAPGLLGGRRFLKGSGRLELAQAVIAPENPLTGRVIVNRIWQHHFGRPLVATPSNFGLQSDPPSHPQLLDYLTHEFVRNGWSLKRLHRRIMLSATYRQSSADRKSSKKIDPANRLLWRMNRRRLDFEGLRDSLLAVSGSLQQKIGGPPVKMFGEQYVPRRTIYGFVDRLNLPGILRTFDFPAPAATNAKRDTTTIAPQALFLMNHRFARETAGRVFSRPEISMARTTESRIRLLYQLLFNRQPNSEETALALEFLKSPANRTPDRTVWITYIHSLLMTNEFVFVD